MIDHVTYHVPEPTLEKDPVDHCLAFFEALGFEEIMPEDPFEHGWLVRWFVTYERNFFRSPMTHRIGPAIHLVEASFEEDQYWPRSHDHLVLGHFCVVRPHREYRLLSQTPWCVRNSGSGRIWMQFANLRVEVRSS